MADDPYRAPVAPVGGREAAEDAAPRPRAVAGALRLLWTVFLASLLALHPAVRGEWWHGDAPPGSELADATLVVSVVLVVVMSLAFIVLLVLIGRRHNWARWGLAAVLMLGWLVLLADLPRSLAEMPLAAAIDLLVMAAETWALWLLFTPPARVWFRRA